MRPKVAKVLQDFTMDHFAFLSLFSFKSFMAKLAQLVLLFGLSKTVSP